MHLWADTPGWRIALDHHDGGYARFSQALWQWVQDFSAQTELPLEPIYSGKAMWGLFRELAAGRIPRGSEVVFIHTGGLQGLVGLKEQGRADIGKRGRGRAGIAGGNAVWHANVPVAKSRSLTQSTA